jgi:hypothetical protein
MRARRAVGLVALSLTALFATIHVRADSLPGRLSDREFWTLISDLSEPDGNFRSDNLLSNELRLQHIIPGLTSVVKPGHVYMGVGPEQNFTYISSLRPAMAFIVDIRRGNLDLHLMYKAIFELSADRGEFVSRLFSKPRQAGLDPALSAAQIFGVYKQVDKSEALYLVNLKAIEDQLVRRHGFDLSVGDLAGIEYTYHAFFEYGPDLRYSSTSGGDSPSQPTYTDLMSAADAAGHLHGFLSSEEAFRVLKDLEGRNMLVPVVGNFGGPKAIRAVGDYVRAKASTVSAFYLSNVEQYLWQDDELWNRFCANLAALPIDDTSTLIRAIRGRPRIGFVPQLGVMAHEVESCRVG